MRIAEFGVQDGYRFTGRNGGARDAAIECLRGSDGFVDPAGRVRVLRLSEMPGCRRSGGLGLDAFGANSHGRTFGENQPWRPC
jgi:hypothetical protein